MALYGFNSIYTCRLYENRSGWMVIQLLRVNEKWKFLSFYWQKNMHNNVYARRLLIY